MDPITFFTQPRLHIVAGKGGVGRTTLAAALALAATELGLDVLVLEIEGRAELPALFGRPPLRFDEVVLSPGDPARGRGSVRARSLNAHAALVEYLSEHGMRRLARTMIDTGVVEVISRGAPGMKDILILGKVKQLERAGTADVVLVDAPASGHAVTFLRSPRGLLDAVSFFAAFDGMEQGFRERSQRVQALLGSSTTAFVLVASPRADTVGEATHFARRLEEQGLTVRALVVNRMHPPFGGMAAADARSRAGKAGGPGRPLGALWGNLADFRAVAEREEETVAGLAARVAPAPVVRVPLLDDDVHDLEGLALVGRHLLGEVPTS